jgi:hypothetical protein
VGLRWSDVDLDNRVVHVRQQTQRRRGTLYNDHRKSRRRRVVPMPALCIAPLRWHQLRQREAFARTGVAWSDKGYVFATRNGRPELAMQDPGTAGFIYWSLAIAFTFITLVPMWILWIDLERWRKYVKRSGKALVHLEAQVRARVEPCTTDSATDGPPQS